MYKPLIIKTPQQKLDGGITNQEQAGHPLRWPSSDKQVTCKWDHIYLREVMKVTPWILCVPLNHKPLQRKYGIHWWSTSQTQSPGTQEGLERLFGTSVNAYNTSTRHEHQLHILPICKESSVYARSCNCYCPTGHNRHTASTAYPTDTKTMTPYWW